MKLASLLIDGTPALGVAVGDHSVAIIDPAFLRARVPSAAPCTSAYDVILAGRTALEALGAAVAAMGATDARVLSVDDPRIAWRPPVPRPGKVCGIAMNNAASNARKISAPDHPAFFLKPSSCLIGHREPIVIRRHYGSTHPEPELAVIIGRRTSCVAPEHAMDAVFGYTIIDDVTSNGMRAEDMFHYYALYPSQANPEELERREQHLSYAGRYKGSDTFGPMGPWLVTKDAVPDPHDLDIVCRVAGQVVAEDSTRYLNHGVPQVISFISRHQTLEPGDVIAMGTAFKPAVAGRLSIHTANLARIGGPVEISIPGFGTLVSPVVIEAGG